MRCGWERKAIGLSFIVKMCVNIMLSGIMWELALRFVTAVLFVNTPVNNSLNM